MSSIVQTLRKKDLLSDAPQFVVSNTMYETIMGSESYGVSNDDSDRDVYGFCIPPKTMIFPHLAGYVPGFGKNLPPGFEQYQHHHIIDKETSREYDITIYNIVKYFQLLMENNPNMIDSIFTPRRCVVHSTKIGEMVRDARKEFLHKGCWHKFKGYAYAQMSKIKNKTNAQNEKRAASIEAYGFDVKFAYHVVRLLDECEQILMTGDLNIEQNREQLKAIRRGEWTLAQLDQWAEDKHRQLEGLYVSSTLRHTPDEDALKNLLVNCLEEHYGNLSNAVAEPNKADKLVAELERLVTKYR
jgi:predicted nucleotidyltransferase